MIWKKLSLIILIAGLAMNPVRASGQVEEIGITQFQEEVSKSWNEAVTILGQIYDSVKLFWQRYTTWRLVPIWEGIEGWFNNQTRILREAFKKDTEKAGEAIKEEVGQARKSLWQTILEAIGIGGGEYWP